MALLVRKPTPKKEELLQTYRLIDLFKPNQATLLESMGGSASELDYLIPFNNEMHERIEMRVMTFRFFPGNTEVIYPVSQEMFREAVEQIDKIYAHRSVVVRGIIFMMFGQQWINYAVHLLDKAKYEQFLKDNGGIEPPTNPQ